MKSMNVPASSQQIACLGFGKNFSSAGKLPEEVSGYIRVKNVGTTLGHIRIYGADGDGMAFSPDETEYLYINEGESVEIVDGSFNIMF